MERIAFLLGTFDPITNGHVYLVDTVLSLGVADKVVVVPCIRNPWKTEPIAYYHERCSMIASALRGKKAILDTIESELPTKDFYYSYEVLSKLYETYNGKENKLSIVCGSDVAESIHEWKNFSECIEGKWSLLVFPRGETDKEIKSKLPFLSLFSIDGVCDISSTLVRERIKSKKDVSGLIPQSIQEKCNEIYGVENRR